MYEYKALVTNVYDGDSITVEIDLGFKTHLKNVKVRVFGVDTPEVRTKNLLEKKAGKLVGLYVRELIEGKTVVVNTVFDKNEKFGRWLGKITMDGLNLTQDLLDRRLAKPYHGSKKEAWTELELNHIIDALSND